MQLIKGRYSVSWFECNIHCNFGFYEKVHKCAVLYVVIAQSLKIQKV